MIMNPNDGFGCGRSVFWEYKAFIFSDELNENCGHITIGNIIVKIRQTKKNRVTLQRFKIRCPSCNNKFEETAKKLTEYLHQFYGLT